MLTHNEVEVAQAAADWWPNGTDGNLWYESGCSSVNALQQVEAGITEGG